MSYLPIGPYGALNLPQHMTKRSRPVLHSRSSRIFRIFSSIHSQNSPRKLLELQLSESYPSETSLPIQSLDAVGSVALPLLSSQEFENSDQEDFFSIDGLDSLSSEMLFLDNEEKDCLEQAFIFWSNVSFNGCEHFFACGDKAEFVKRKQKWCEENPAICSSISLLSITNCDLKTIPTDILYFKNLKYLDVSGNKLEDISNLSGLIHLEKLYLQYNALKAVPDDFFNQMDKLKEVFINNNKISETEELISLCAEKPFNITVYPQSEDNDWTII